MKRWAQPTVLNCFLINNLLSLNLEEVFYIIVCMSTHKDFETQLNHFGKEVDNLSFYVYAEFSINHAASKSRRLLDRLNKTPYFWKTVQASFQTATYITLGRIFDQHKDSLYTIDKLFSSAESNITLFQRDALSERKRRISIFLDNPSRLEKYLAEAYYPNQKDFDKLKKKVLKYRALYGKAFKPARNKYIAHREKQGLTEVSALFGCGKVKELWQLTLFLYQLYQILLKLFLDGQKPQFRPLRYSINSIYPDANSFTNSAHELIVYETKKLMNFLENATLENAIKKRV